MPEPAAGSASETLPVAPPETPALVLPPLPLEPLAGAVGLDADALVRAEERAYRLYMEGKRQLEAGDPQAAERTFADALRTLPNGRPYDRSRGSLALWWVRCHVALFEHTGEHAVLERETRILDAYARRLDELSASSQDRAHKQALVQHRLDEIEAVRQLQAIAQADVQTQLQHQHEGRHASTWAPDSLKDLGWYPRPDDPRARVVQARDAEAPTTEGEGEAQRKLDRARRPGLGLVITGSLSMAAGVAGLGVMAAGMARGARANDFDPDQSPMARREQIVEGLDANTMSVAGAIAGGGMLGIGIISTVMGAVRAKKKDHGDERSARLSVGPWGLEGRF